MGNVDDRWESFVKCTVNGIHVFSYYLPPSLSIEDFKRVLDGIVSEAMNVRPVVIAGDFNAWAVEWGSAYTNPSGECLLEAFAMLEFVLLNRGHKDAFTRNGRCSKIDLTFVSHPHLPGWYLTSTHIVITRLSSLTSGSALRNATFLPHHRTLFGRCLLLTGKPLPLRRRTFGYSGTRMTKR